MQRRVHQFRSRFHSGILVLAAVLLALTAVALFNTTQPPPQRLTQRDIDAAVARALASATPGPSFASQAFQVIHPSLVRVQANIPGTDPRSDTAVGTGVVIDENGTVLTSLHVVSDGTSLRVTFADGTQSAADIVVAQPENDLAVLRPHEIPDDLVPATLAGSPSIGDEVFAAGHPFGISNSLTAGVVSGLGREYRSSQTRVRLTNLIQFDAAVNPGNSGGPLVNRSGEVVGIVTGLLNPTDQNVFIGIGFAVPIETAAGALGSPPY
jgi:S1-C subfamily serine protease